MNRRLRRAVFLALLALGALGLLATGSGVWAGSPWPWLVVLALGVAAQVAGDHYDQRLRLARSTEKRLRDVEERITGTHREFEDRIYEVRQHINSVGTPEGMKALVENVNRLVTDFKPIKEEMDSVRSAGGLRALFSRR